MRPGPVDRIQHGRGERDQGTESGAGEHGDEDKEDRRAVAEPPAGRGVDDQRPERERRDEERQVLHGMQGRVRDGGLVGTGQMPAPQGGDGGDEDEQRVEHDPGRLAKAPAGGQGPQATPGRRRKAEERDETRPAVDEQRWCHHQKHEVLQHVDRQQGVGQGVDR